MKEKHLLDLKDLERLELTLWDTGKYQYIEASTIGKSKRFLVFPNKDRTNLVYGKCPYWHSSYSIALFSHAPNGREQILDILLHKEFIFNRIPKDGVPLTKELIEEVEKPEPLPESLIYLVGNIVEERAYGEEHIVKNGTKNFSGGTKVYVAPPYSGSCGRIIVTGKPRGKKGGLITQFVAQKYITNFRVKIIYSPSVIKKLVELGYYWDNIDYAKDCADTGNQGIEMN